MILRQQNPFGSVVLCFSSPIGLESGTSFVQPWHSWRACRRDPYLILSVSSTTDRPQVALECTLQGVALGQLLLRSTRYSLSWPEGLPDDDPGVIDPHLQFFVTAASALVQLLGPSSFPRASIIPRDALVLLWPRCSPHQPTLSPLLSPSLTSLFAR